MKILKLTAENIKRIRAVEITPTGNTVVIAGLNASGKSSTIDAIAMALGGKALCPEEPIRRGADKGFVRLDVGDFIITRTFLASGGGALTVTNREGARYPSPQAVLDGLVGALAFDPLSFAHAAASDQALTLRRLAQIDTTDADLERQRLYDDRTVANRQVATAKGAFERAPHFPELGETPETFDQLTADLADADRLADQANVADVARVGAVMAREAAALRATRAQGRVADLQRALEAATSEWQAAERDAAAALADEAGRIQAWTRAMAAVPDRTALRARLGTIQATNQHIAANQQRAALAAALAAATAEAARLTAAIAAIDTAKAAQLAAATFPLAGLGLSDAGVTWEGLPFTQASTAVKLRVSVAIGAALARTLRIALVRNGNDLDADSLGLLATFAQDHDLMLWIERIDGGHGLHTVRIEDGAVAGEPS